MGKEISLAYQRIPIYTNHTMKNKKADRNEFMTLPEVAEYLRLSIHTIYKMAQKGRIPALKAGAVWRFNRAEIDEWMRSEAERRQEERRRKARDKD